MMPPVLHKNRLFWRLFWAFLATLLVTVGVLSLLMVMMVRQERRNALETEVLVQTRDVASLMRQYDVTSFFAGSRGLANAVNYKIQELQTQYDAEIWLVTSSRRVIVLTDREFSQEVLSDPRVVEQLYRVLSGEEIRAQGLIPALGSDYLTMGVPWVDAMGNVSGAVLMNLSTARLSVDYSDMIRNALIAACAAMLLGTALAWWIARRQSEPLRQINLAVRDFAQGKLDRRVALAGDDEIAQLGQSFNRMAEDLSNLENSRKSFVASVSHELRSPLTCMRGYCEGMLDGTIPEAEYPRYLGVVVSETKRLTKLVNELLELSRFESGKFPLALSRFDLNELLRVELLKFEGRIDEKKIDVEVSLSDGPCFVEADPDRIRQVATNLMDNAVKFTPEGGTISLGASVVDKNCYVTVSNSGPAIPQEDLPFLFDRFFKGDKAHTAGRGTGLGLSIVKRIVEEHGGKISVSSQAGRTSFTFSLTAA